MGQARFFIIIATLMLLVGCSAVPITKPDRGNLPPVLSQDELLKPYTKIGRIQITREVYFQDYHHDPNLQEWGLRALREEAYKMGADAIILPEVTSKKNTIILFPAFPSTEYRAAGVAIKFK